jgi:hypothetical protein
MLLIGMFHKKLIMNAMRARVLLIPWLLFAMALFTLKDREALGSEQKKPEQQTIQVPPSRQLYHGTAGRHPG